MTLEEVRNLSPEAIAAQEDLAERAVQPALPGRRWERSRTR